MDNLSRIKKLSRIMQKAFGLMLVLIPAYYLVYWVFINQLPGTLISVNMEAGTLAPHALSPYLQAIGFGVSLLPMAALMLGVKNLRKLFASYGQGLVFSLGHVAYLKKIAKALLLWLGASVLYETAKSVIFSMSNPPGQRMISIGFGSAELTLLMVGLVVLVIARVMEEGRVMAEEQALTI